MFPAGALFAVLGILLSMSALASGLGWFVYLSGMIALLGVALVLVRKFGGEAAQLEFIGVWMPGWIFFALGSSFFWAAYVGMQGHDEQGRVLVLGGIFSVLGFLVLASAAVTKLVYRKDPEKARLSLGRVLGALGLLIAGLVLLVFFALGIFAIVHNPENPWGGIVLLLIPTLFLTVFFTIRRLARRKDADG